MDVTVVSVINLEDLTYGLYMTHSGVKRYLY